MSALSETPEMASSHCSFGSDPPRKSFGSGCEIILHVLKPPFLMWGSPRPCGWLVVATGTLGQAPGRIQPVVTPHPKEWGLPGAWNREKVSPCCWPLQAPPSTAGRSPLAEEEGKSLTLELTEFMQGVVGDGHDC